MSLNFDSKRYKDILENFEVIWDTFKKDYSKIGLVVHAYNPNTQEAEDYAGTHGQLPTL